MQRRSASINRPLTISAISAIALLASACGTTTTTPSGASTGNGTAGTIGEGAAAADVIPVAASERPDDSRTPTSAPSAGDETQTQAESDVATGVEPTSETEPTNDPGDEMPPETDPPVTPPVTIPPVILPNPPIDEPTPTPTVPPVFVPPTPVITVPPVFFPNPVLVPPTPAPPITIPPVFVPASPCGPVANLAPGANIVSEIAVDLDGDGDLDEALSFVDGGWGIRTVVNGVVSHIDVSGVGPHAVELLGGTDVASITPGNEIIATISGGPSFVNIGVVGVDGSGCAFLFDDVGGDPLALPVGATINHATGLGCAPGSLHEFGFDRQADDTFTAWGSGLHETTAGVFGYLPASDDFSKGLTEDELPAATLNCNGITF